jgi:hypothetical protein
MNLKATKERRMFKLWKRKRPGPPSADTLLRMAIIEERKSFRDFELKLLRSTVTGQRQDINGLYKNKHITEKERDVALHVLGVIDRDAIDVALANNRQRLAELGVSKKPRNRAHEVTG